MAKNFTGHRGGAFAERKGVTSDADATDSEQKGRRGLEATRLRNASAWQARLPLRKETTRTKVFPQSGQSEFTFVSLVLCAESQPLMNTNSQKPISVDSRLIRGWFSLARETRRVFQNTGRRATDPKMGTVSIGHR